MAIERRCRLEHAWNRQHHAALNIGYFNPLQVERGTLSGERLIRGTAVNLNTANASSLLRRKYFDFFFLFHLAGDERSCDDRSKSLHRETAIHRKPEYVFCVLRPDFADE